MIANNPFYLFIYSECIKAKAIWSFACVPRGEIQLSFIVILVAQKKTALFDPLFD